MQLEKENVIFERSYLGRKVPSKFNTAIQYKTQEEERINDMVTRNHRGSLEDARDSPIETVLSLTITATALLGCDQLWHFLNTALPRHTIPSGLKLIPSKLGYLLTGRQRTAEEQEGLANASRKRSMRTPEASESLRLLPNNTVFTYTTLPDFENELSRWDKYWTMDSARVCELADRRNDGYYVRLPYKEELALLPSNKTIALKRLTDTFAILRSRPDIMQQYQQTIDSQLKAGIIEIVPNDHSPQDQLHYVSHQTMITP
ncbi:hypothetical protein RB195_025561 [Necator americanus]|uniref:Uncharacterized protein n=1 Tax=Necator americanus TaxID=51031 RepID=A0ABR1ESV7_NECAM